MSDGPSPTEIARDLATRGRRASAILATASTETKNGALEAMARHLEADLAAALE
jgi:gamma-glutamyl phosphate reductase